MVGPMKILKFIDQIIEKVEAYSLILSLFVMVLVSFSQVILRNFFHSALPFGDGLTRALVLWSGFIGASLAVKEGKFINVDVFNRMLSEKWRKISRVIVYFFSVGVCFFLGYAGTLFVLSEKESATMSQLGLPTWILVVIIPLTFYFLCFRFTIKALGLMMGDELEKAEWER